MKTYMANPAKVEKKWYVGMRKDRDSKGFISVNVRKTRCLTSERAIRDR